MIRLLGAIAGSALALAALLLLVGVPQFKTVSPDIERPLVTLPLATTAVEEAEPVAADATTTAGDEPPAMPPAEPEHAVAANEPDEFGPPPIADERDWYSFWSPFRSELAATGFVAQLQRVTGLDYRVVKVKTGVYEVAFAYRDDADITGHLSQITAATGLEMAER